MCPDVSALWESRGVWNSLNEAIHPIHQGTEFGVDMGFRAPLFDIEITAQKQSPYSKLSQNELALQFYSAGFFDPARTQQALMCLEMMDFDRKEFIMQQVYKNGSMEQQPMMAQQQSLFLAQQLDRTDGGNRAAQIAASITGGMGMPMINAAPQRASQTEALGGDSGAGEAENTKKARQRVADSTAPT